MCWSQLGSTAQTWVHTHQPCGMPSCVHTGHLPPHIHPTPEMCQILNNQSGPGIDYPDQRVWDGLEVPGEQLALKLRVCPGQEWGQNSILSLSFKREFSLPLWCHFSGLPHTGHCPSAGPHPPCHGLLPLPPSFHWTLAHAVVLSASPHLTLARAFDESQGHTYLPTPAVPVFPAKSTHNPLLFAFLFLFWRYFILFIYLKKFIIYVFIVATLGFRWGTRAQ